MIYKNTSDQELSIPEVGMVKPGEEVEMPEGFNNANFTLVKKSSKAKVDEDELKSKKEE